MKGILEFPSTQAESVEEGAIHEAVEARRVVKQKSLRKLVSEGKSRGQAPAGRAINTAIKMLVPRYPVYMGYQNT